METMGDKVLGVRFVEYTDKKTGEERIACVLSLASEALGKDERNWGLSTYEQFVYKSQYNQNYEVCEDLREGDRVLLLRNSKGYLDRLQKV